MITAAITTPTAPSMKGHSSIGGEYTPRLRPTTPCLAGRKTEIFHGAAIGKNLSC
jgi:hypothetical protein